MDYTAAFAISAAGMSAEKSRVDVATLNLANANTVKGVDGKAYQPLRATILSAVRSGSMVTAAFADQVDDGLDDPAGTGSQALGLPAVSIEPTGAQPRQVYEPGNPYADDKGFVEYAAVDSATEMVTMMSALRSYEANVAAMNMAKTLAMRALDIGGTSS